MTENFNSTTKKTHKSCPRTVSFSRGHNIDDCIQELIDRQRIELIKIGDGNSTGRNSLSIELIYILSSPHDFAEKIDVPLSEEMIKNYPQFFQQHFTRFLNYYGRNNVSRSIHYDEMCSYFNLVYRYFYYHLSYNKIELLIQFTVPHDPGFDFILNEVAVLLGIKVLWLPHIMTPMFPNKSHILPNLDALSNHHLLIPINNEPHIPLHHKTPSYMDDIIKIQKSPLRAFCILPCMKFVYDFISILFFNIKNFIKAIHQVNKRVNSSNSSIFHKNLFLTLVKMGTGCTRNLLKNVFTGAWYKYQLSKYSVGEQKINWNNKYVYFPLHLQPELTTSALGDVYENQLYAIECLRRILPDDWKVYVKENPNQYRLTTYPLYWRKQSFFLKRIQKMHNVVLISDEVDTNKLIDNSIFVSTITGTAGWEALVNGKQVLVFGHAWYGMFSGCTRYNSSTTLEEILSNKTDKDKLQQAVDFFADRLATGITSVVTLNTVENFDKEQNAKTVADAIEKYIDYYFPENESEQID